MPLLSRAELWQKNGRIYEFTWKFALPQLSRGKTCPKIKLFCWCDFKIWSAPMITIDILQKNQEVLIVPFGNLNYPYCHKVKVSTKIGPFLYSLLKIRPSLISQAEIFAKIKQFCWGILKTYTATVITNWNFLNNRAILIRCFENLNCPYYY